MRIGQFAVISLSVVLTAFLLAGCTEKESPQDYIPKELKVQFVPSQNAETLEAKAKPLEKLLSAKLGIPVKVSVSTSYNTIIEAMASKQVNVGFLPPNTYVLAHDQKKAADVLLQAQRFGVNDSTGQPTTELVDTYKSMLVVKADSPIKTIKELKGKKVAWQDVTSSAGYVWPAAELKKEGLDPDKDVTGITIKGHDKAILALLNGEVDAAAVFQDIRVQMKDVPDAFAKTRVLKFTANIPNDTICVRSDMDTAYRDILQQAFIDIGKDPEGKKIISEVYSHQGYVASTDSNFDIVREYAEQVGQK
ncbi:MAG: putative phosphonate transporter, phosphonate-binding protein [Paenibacillus sp.]|nr:putative phosphonate transporter, phosphonate-binding protein [Paenibacillus sp.]